MLQYSFMCLGLHDQTDLRTQAKRQDATKLRPDPSHVSGTASWPNAPEFLPKYLVTLTRPHEGYSEDATYHQGDVTKKKTSHLCCSLPKDYNPRQSVGTSDKPILGDIPQHTWIGILKLL